jgi:hydroxylamine reductase (hybrid-cluster protein)
MKYCIIRKVPFKMPGKKLRIFWANVIAENQGLVLVIVPKPNTNQSHSLFIATENIEGHVFEAVTEHQFNLESADVQEAGDRLRLLGKQFTDEDFMNQMRHNRRDDY